MSHFTKEEVQEMIRVMKLKMKMINTIRRKNKGEVPNYIDEVQTNEVDMYQRILFKLKMLLRQITDD